MLFNLFFEVDESFSRARYRVRTLSVGVQSARRQREVRGKNIFGPVRLFLETAVELHQIGLIGLEQLSDFRNVPIQCRFNGLRRFDMAIADGYFHGGTRIQGIEGDAIADQI